MCSNCLPVANFAIFLQKSGYFNTTKISFSAPATRSRYLNTDLITLNLIYIDILFMQNIHCIRTKSTVYEFRDFFAKKPIIVG